MRSGSSYCSQNELPVTVGLGGAGAAEEIVIWWPSGEKTMLGKVSAGQVYHIIEGKGIVRQTPLGEAAKKAARVANSRKGNGA